MWICQAGVTADIDSLSGEQKHPYPEMCVRVCESIMLTTKHLNYFRPLGKFRKLFSYMNNMANSMKSLQFVQTSISS